MVDNNSFVLVIFNSSTDYNYTQYNITFNSTQTGSREIYYPIRDSLEIVIPLTVLYSLIFVSGMLGNIITCIVIARNRAMHTATNYYLFSLAVSDLLLLISGMPLEIYGIWYRYPFPFGNTVCILQGFAAETSANATVLTITAFTAERYIAICHPFLSHTMSKLSRAIKFILGIWLLAMILAVPQILDLGITDLFGTCVITSDSYKHVFTFSTILCFVFPMTVITVLYIQIGLQLRRSKIVGRAATANGNSIRLKTKCRVPSQRNILLTLDRSGKPNMLLTPVPSPSLMEAVCNGNKQEVTQRISNPMHDEGRKNYSQKGCTGTRHVVNMLAVVVAFFVCWAPHHAQRLFAMNADAKYGKIYDILTNISGVLYYVSTCINPFLYNIMSHKFREAFKETCARYFYRKGRGNFQQETLSRNMSQRSNSQSIHTCSSICSGPLIQQASARILEQDLSLLRSTKRPLTVKFKRPARSQNTILQARDLCECDCSKSSRCMRDSNTNKCIAELHNKSPIYQSYNETSKAIQNDQFKLRCQTEIDTLNYSDMRRLRREKTNQESDYDIICKAYCQRMQEYLKESSPKYGLSSSPSPTDYEISNEIHSIRERFPSKRYSTFDNRHQRRKGSDMNTSPYESPELTANSKRLEINIQNILKDLVLYDNLGSTSKSNTVRRKRLSRSRSTSNLTIKNNLDCSTTLECNCLKLDKD